MNVYKQLKQKVFKLKITKHKSLFVSDLMNSTKFFATQLVAAVAMAQLPRECFYVTEIHGKAFEGTDLLSDLPALTSMYKPGMKLQTVVGLQDAEADDVLTGLQVHLHDPVKKT